jgi:hypothetical protein
VEQELFTILNDNYDFSLFLANNKVNKLVLQDVNNLQRIQSALDFFYRIKFLVLQYVKCNMVKSAILRTLQKMKRMNMINVTLCVCILDAEDDVVQQVHELIKSKNLLENYDVCRECDKVYVQWKE